MVAWATTLTLTGRSSVASLLASITLVLSAAILKPGVLPVVLVLALGVALTHTANIRRLIRGEENQVVQPVRWNRPPAPGAAELLEHGPAGVPIPRTDPPET